VNEPTESEAETLLDREGFTTRWVVWRPDTGRVVTAPGGRVWCESIVAALGESWEVKEFDRG